MAGSDLSGLDRGRLAEIAGVAAADLASVRPHGFKPLVGQQLSVINWIYYPKSTRATPVALAVVDAFVQASDAIDSAVHELPSNAVLAAVAGGLSATGFIVETGKRAEEKIRVPVLFGLNGRLDKTFDADAYHQAEGFVVEVEAGRRQQPVPQGPIPSLHDARGPLSGDRRPKHIPPITGFRTSPPIL